MSLRILLDECLPRRLADELAPHNVTTVPRAGWAGLRNSLLLARIGNAYDVFITVDQNLTAQQNVNALPFGVIVLRAPSNTLAALRPLLPRVRQILAGMVAGRIEVVSTDA